MDTVRQPITSTRLAETLAKRIRVLHIVENLDCQAVESWLLRVLSAARADYSQISWSFFCVLGRPGRLDDMARGLGAEVIHSRYEIGDKLRFMHSLREVMKRGRYDILHCHHDVMSAAYLVASQGLPFQKRIVHVHNTALSLPTSNRLKISLAREPMRQMCLQLADQIVGISRDALESMVKDEESRQDNHTVVHYAVDTERFSRVEIDREAFRTELGLDPGVKVLLFVGRIVAYKNPALVLEILKDLLRVGSDVVAVFAGTGDQEEAIREMAARKRVGERIRLLGFREDVPKLMVNSDLLVWPSLEDPKEGLGLGIIEAQAAGLPILMSRSVPEEAIVVSELVTVLPLAAGPEAWAQKALDILDRQHPSHSDSLARVEASSFSMPAGVGNLMALYEGLEN